MPKRGAIALAITSTALVLVLSFKTPSSSVAGSGSGQVAVADPTTGSATEAPTSSSGTGTSTTPTATPNPTQAGTSSGAYKDGTYTGSVVDTRYGPVQVKVTISGGQITAVTAPELPSDHPRSAEISSIAGPMLADEALQAQGASIDFISGATFTSDAYATSLQSALDKAA